MLHAVHDALKGAARCLSVEVLVMQAVVLGGSHGEASWLHFVQKGIQHGTVSPLRNPLAYSNACCSHAAHRRSSAASASAHQTAASKPEAFVVMIC